MAGPKGKLHLITSPLNLLTCKVPGHVLYCCAGKYARRGAYFQEVNQMHNIVHACVMGVAIESRDTRCADGTQLRGGQIRGKSCAVTVHD